MIKPRKTITTVLTPRDIEEVALILKMNRAREEAGGHAVPHIQRLETLFCGLAGLPTDRTPAPDVSVDPAMSLVTTS